MNFDGSDLRGLSPSGDEPAARQPDRLHPAGADVQPRPRFRIGSQLIEPMRQPPRACRRPPAGARRWRCWRGSGIPDPSAVFDSYPHQISGGMAQRVLIAGAVSCDPDLLIADEPTTALDVTVQAEVLDLMRELQQERSMGVMLVTHDFGVVADLCDTRRGDADRPDRRDRPGRAAVRRPAAPLHPHAAGLHPRRHRAAHGARRPRAGRRSRSRRPMMPPSTPAPDGTLRRAAAGRRPGRRRVPRQRPPQAPFRALHGVSLDVARRGDASAWSGSPARARPPWAARSSAWRR